MQLLMRDELSQMYLILNLDAGSASVSAKILQHKDPDSIPSASILNEDPSPLPGPDAAAIHLPDGIANTQPELIIWIYFKDPSETRTKYSSFIISSLTISKSKYPLDVKKCTS